MAVCCKKPHAASRHVFHVVQTIDVYDKPQTSNRILTSTVTRSNLGQFVLFLNLKLDHEFEHDLAAYSCRKRVKIIFKYMKFSVCGLP